jgi:Fic family protein
MEATIKTIDEFAATLQSLQPIKPEYQQKLDKKIRLEFNYNSNHIEGNTLTYGETELLLIFDKTTGNHDLREYEEMKAHDVAFEVIKDWAADKERPLTEAAIKNLHELLLVRPFWKEAITPDGQPTRRLIEVGTYKKYPNSVRLQNGEIFHYASPEETPILMGELIQWYRDEEEKGEIHPVALAALLHYRFVRIHPFDDGNGRMTRLLMNYVLLRHHLPPVIIKSADKRNYLFALNQADTGDLNAFIKYVVTQAIWSLELTIKAAKGEDVEERDDWEKELLLLKKDKTLKQKFTSELSNKVKNNIYYPFVKNLVDKLAIFDSWFLEKQYFFKVTNHYEEIKDLENIKSIGLGFWDYKSIADTTSFKLVYNKLKQTREPLHYIIEVKLLFNLYSYAIELPKEKIIIEKEYGFSVSKEKIEEVIAITAKQLLQLIKERLPK